ncbi:MAG: ABC transporter permease [Pirellulales bacterium]|nr:ABC transporter permease [Pirellulales bacterium]
MEPDRRLAPAQFTEASLQVFVMCGLLALLVFVTGWWNPQFLSAYSLRSVLRDTAIWSLFALGQAIVIISGGIDLSVGSLIAFVGVLALMLLGDDFGLALPTVLVIVSSFAVFVGVLHGSLICGLNLQPFLVTLCSLLILRGLARVMTHDRTVSFDAGEHALLRTLGAGSLCGVPIPVFILAGALVPLGFFMHHTVPGRYLYAIGSNVDAARYSGVRVNALRIVSYALCSLLTAVAAVLEAGDVASVPPSNAGLAYEMYGITGAVLGGCSLRGGQGSLLGVVVGMATLRVIKSVVIFFNLSTYWTFAVTGLVLLAAVVVDSLVRARSQSR